MRKTQKKPFQTKKKLNANTEIYILEALVAVALVLGILFVFFASRQPGTVDREPTKLDLLAKEAVTQDTLDYIKINPAYSFPFVIRRIWRPSITAPVKP